MKAKLMIYGLLALIVVAVTSTVHALPPNAHDIIYYSDNTYVTAVGERYVGCGGSSSSGVRSGYIDEVTWDCARGMQVACDRVFCYGNSWVDQYGNTHWDHCESQGYCGW